MHGAARMNAVVTQTTNGDLSFRKPAPLPTRDDRWAIFFDVDGCLVEFRPAPELVKIPDAVRASLSELQIVLAGAVALVSGRTLDDLDNLFAPLILPSAGQYGMRRRSADGVLHSVLLPEKQVADFVRRRALETALRFPGLKVEDKGFSVALHYRTAPHLADAVAAAAASIVASLGDAYEVQPGAMVQEIKPTTCSKGCAVRAFLAEPPFKSRTPVFLGDDFADESAFAAVNTLGGVSIAVGVDRFTQAQYTLAGPAAARSWLANVVEVLSH
jgi:trehalose 6-phosphate phosphatase